jgi:hypothetical protein
MTAKRIAKAGTTNAGRSQANQPDFTGTAGIGTIAGVDNDKSGRHSHVDRAFRTAKKMLFKLVSYFRWKFVEEISFCRHQLERFTVVHLSSLLRIVRNRSNPLQAGYSPPACSL